MPKIVVANWKLNKNLDEIKGWFNEFDTIFTKDPNSNIDVVVALSSPYLGVSFLQEKPLYLASQDVSVHEKGSHTGEVGAFQLRDYCKYSIVGHSERQEEPDVVIGKRNSCLKYGIKPLLCFINPGEASSLYTDGVVLVWEDPSNISKDGIYNPKDPKEIEGILVKMKESLPESASVLYGGSVNRQSIGDLSNISQLDGVLVGNASLDATHFYEIINAFKIT